MIPHKEIDECFIRDGPVILCKLIVNGLKVVILHNIRNIMQAEDYSASYRIHNSEARQRCGHFGDVESIRLITIEVAKCALKLLELCGGQVCHVPRDNLIAVLNQQRLY